MGMDQRVTIPAGKNLSWKDIADLLAARRVPVQLRMIDGQLAFPDEVPDDSWRELRVSTAGGMTTLRREENAVLLVTWGNAAEALRREWNALTWAIAEATAGQVTSAAGTVSPAEFLANAEFPPDFGVHG
jgi:hypothetical protein